MYDHIDKAHTMKIDDHGSLKSPELLEEHLDFLVMVLFTSVHILYTGYSALKKIKDWPVLK